MKLSEEYSSMILLIDGSTMAHGGHQVAVKTSITVVFADEPDARGFGPTTFRATCVPFPATIGKAITIEPTTISATTAATETATPTLRRMVSPPSGSRCYGPFLRPARHR